MKKRRASGASAKGDEPFDSMESMELLAGLDEEEDDAAVGGDLVITLSRGESGLGLVFDVNNVVSKLLPGCAAAESGEIQVGDVLKAVDDVEIAPGDRIDALFPMSETTFVLRLSRGSGGGVGGGMGVGGDGGGSAVVEASSALYQRELATYKKEQPGKFDAQRPLPVYQEVVFNEYCVLFPDGSSAPFNEKVRYTDLNGYLRKRGVISEGRAEFALAHGESQRGYARHFFHLSMKHLRWFDEDPEVVAERQRLWPTLPLTSRWASRLSALKLQYSSGKGVGSALFHAAPCRLYVSRLYRNEFAVSFGGGKLLVLQAATGSDARQWVVAIASCLFFSSATYESVLVECKRFFDAAYKTVEGRLSLIEALDLVRAMGREVTYSQVVSAAEAVGVSGEGEGWLGLREFIYLVRTVCADADPRTELLRAFRLLNRKSGAGAGTSSVSSGGKDAAAESVMSSSDLIEAMTAARVPDEHVQTVLRAAGAAGKPGERVRYARLADALYPAAATAAKRRKKQLGPVEEEQEMQAEAIARMAWERQRREIAVAGTRNAPVAGAPAAASTRVPAAVPPQPPGSMAAPAPDVPSLKLGGVAALNTGTAAARSSATPRTIAARVNRARQAQGKFLRATSAADGGGSYVQIDPRGSMREASAASASAGQVQLEWLAKEVAKEDEAPAPAGAS